MMNAWEELKGMNLDHDFMLLVNNVVQKMRNGSPIQYLYINQLMFFYYLFVLSYEILIIF